MQFTSIQTAYFRGEQIEALVFILPLGLLSLVFGAWLLSDSPTSFMRGVAIPFFVLGLLLVVTGATVGLRTPGQLAELQRCLLQRLIQR
jgi:Ca2+/Na+ antiporter